MLSVLVGVNRGLNIKTTLGEILKVDLPDNRVFGLDLLRAAAILFVVYGHGAFTLAALLPKTLVQLPLMDGVSIFFVLSGYLIGGIILKIYERFPADAGLVWRFWLRRWFRTLPNYFLILVVLVVYHVAFEDLSFAAVWRYFFFLQNFASNHPAFFPEAWSLSVEEWFYIFLPVSLLILVRAGLRVPTALLSLIAITIIASLAFRYGRLLELEANDHPLGKLRVWDGIFRKQVVMRLDSLMYGVFGAYLHYYHGGVWEKYKKVFLLVGLGLLLLHKVTSFYIISGLPSHSLYYSVFSFAVISLGTLMLLPWLSQLHCKDGFFYRIITIISLTSYSMYLVHFSLVRNILVPGTLQLAPNLDGSGFIIAHYGLYWLYTVLLSIVLYKYFELPMMNMRERFANRAG